MIYQRLAKVFLICSEMSLIKWRVFAIGRAACREDRVRQQDAIRRALELSRPTGVITFDQLNDLLPSATMTPEDIEAVMRALSNEGINVVESDPP
jgi:RNA polymerase primary sigma factor